MPSPQHESGVSELSWRTRIRALRNINVVFGIAWETSKGTLFAGICLRIIRAGLPFLTLVVSKLMLDAIVAWTARRMGDPKQLWRLVLVQLAIALATAIVSRGIAVSEAVLGNGFTERLTIRLMEHATQLDLASFDDPVFYDKLERARRQASGRVTPLGPLLNMGQDVLTLAFFSVGLLVFSPWLIILLIATALPAFLGEAHFTSVAYRMLHRRTPELRHLDYIRFLGTSAVAAKELRVLGLAGHLIERYRKASQTLRKENQALAVRKATIGGALSLISAAGYYSAYAFVLQRVLAGGISIGMFTFLTGSFSRSRQCIERILYSFNDLSEQALFLSDLFDFFATRPAIRTMEHAVPAPRSIRQGFEFQRVSFAYPGSDRLVLRDLSTRLHPDEAVAVVGENGAGKTTFIKLLARLYEPTEGRILLDGVDLRDYRLEDLRREIGVIFQDFMRYDLSARDNIGFGAIDAIADDDRIISAARASGAAVIVDRFSDGYNQILGKRFEGGAELSGGEWQKIALARAHMRNAQVLLLDEPASALDAQSEHQVFQNLMELKKNRLVVLISHRLTTIRLADRILVLANGGIEEQGTHPQLLAQDGRYARLFNYHVGRYR